MVLEGCEASESGLVKDEELEAAGTQMTPERYERNMSVPLRQSWGIMESCYLMLMMTEGLLEFLDPFIHAYRMGFRYKRLNSNLVCADI